MELIKTEFKPWKWKVIGDTQTVRQLSKSAKLIPTVAHHNQVKEIKSAG